MCPQTDKPSPGRRHIHGLRTEQINQLASGRAFGIAHAPHGFVEIRFALPLQRSLGSSLLNQVRNKTSRELQQPELRT